MISVPLNDLSPIDEHCLTVAAPPQVVGDATLESVGASFSAPWPRRLARLLRTDPALVIPAGTGHVSIAFDLDSNPADHLQAIVLVLARRGLSTG